MQRKRIGRTHRRRRWWPLCALSVLAYQCVSTIIPSTPNAGQYWLPSDEGNGPGDEAFVGSSNFLQRLRQEYEHKMASPLPHCRNNSTASPNGQNMRLFNRAVEVDWIGRELSSVVPTWSASDTASCQFVALAFPPTDAALDRALEQRTYVSAFRTASQCGPLHSGGKANASVTCRGINFPGTLGGKTLEECEEAARGVYLNVSTMRDSPSSLLRSFTGSLGSVLPPPPTLVYSKNALLGNEQLITVPRVPPEAYFPGCTQYWHAMSTARTASRAVAKHSPQLLQLCSGGGVGECPYPVYDVVVEVFQAFCSGVFHVMIEIFPRIAPFLDSLAGDDMPAFAIRNGCGEVKDFVHQAYRLVGLNATILGDETVFAKEVLVPTEGFAHSPLLNYWNVLSVRRHVERRIGPIPASSSSKKIVLVIVRDASRRSDDMIYNERFLEQLAAGLPDHNVTTFRSSNDALMGCLACQVKAFMAADVIIGSHGAGLSHLMFAKAGATVLERIVSGNDSGIYAELSFIMGLKYFPVHNAATAEAYRDIILFADGH